MTVYRSASVSAQDHDLHHFASNYRRDSQLRRNSSDARSFDRYPPNPHSSGSAGGLTPLSQARSPLYQAQHATHTPPPALPPPATPFPARHPPPPQPVVCYQIPKPTTTNKLSSDGIYREFVLVEGHISNLLHRNATLEAQVDWLRERLEASQGYFDAGRAELDLAKNRLLKDFEKQMDELKARMAWAGNDESEGEVGGEDDDESNYDDSDSEEELKKGRKKKGVVWPLPSRFLDVPKLCDPKLLPIIDEDDPSYFTNLPLLRGSCDVQQQRFYWTRPVSDPHNHRALEVMVAHAIKFAPSSGIEDVENALARLKHGDLEKHFKARFQRIKKKFKGTDGAPSTKPGGEMTIGKNNNRAPGKLAVRKRKRGQLPPDHKYQDSKYDDAMYYQLMSEDDDTFDENGQLKHGEYTSRRPTWRSEDLNDFFKTIDAIDDPKSSTSYWKRVPGAPREVPLKTTISLAGRTHRWMVDNAWWEENKKDNDKPSMIVLEGDVEARELVDAVKKKRKERSKSAGPGRASKKAKTLSRTKTSKAVARTSRDQGTGSSENADEIGRGSIGVGEEFT
ncbi:hypothetical protein H1R20_g10866, partial [Candolleomyces eurysporus]